MQTGNLANNSQKQCHVLLNTNQIKLYTYPDLLKENPLLRKFLNSETTAYFLDETFYHTHIPLSSITISAAILIKPSSHLVNFYLGTQVNFVAHSFFFLSKILRMCEHN